MASFYVHRALILYLTLFLFQYGGAQVTADFSFTTDGSGCGSLQADFCDQSTSTAGNIVSWNWELGGVSVNQECPSRIFGTPGTYTICVTATDDQGNSDTHCKDDLITVFNLPKPDFEATTPSGCSPLSVGFIDLSEQGDAPIMDRLWDLGGPCGVVTGNGGVPDAFCTYTLADDYTISLTVTDQNGCSATKSKAEYVQVSAKPALQIGINQNTACEPPFTVQLTNVSPTADITFYWDFGNGDTFQGANPAPVTYTEIGTFPIVAVAENNSTGCRDTLAVSTVQVGNPIQFEFSQSLACQDQTISFTDLSGLPADSVRWDFGNGDFSTEANPEYAFSNLGCYSVTLTRWIDGCENEQVANSCIQIQSAPSVFFNNDNSRGCSLPHTVNFASNAPTAVSYSWDFGDGESSSQNFPVHTYDTYGKYVPVLTVTDAKGCTKTYEGDTIRVEPVVASLATTPPVAGCSPFVFSLNENSSTVVPNVIWQWEIQTDQNLYIQNGQTGTFAIPDTGVFDVTLMVENGLGCRDTATFEEVVTIGFFPDAQFSAPFQEECVGVPVPFIDESSSYADTWHWQFGDGEESFEPNPTHIFQDTGFYDISLMVGHNGCTNELVLNDYIHILEPLSKFEILQDCETLYSVTMEDRSVGAMNVIWDFGLTNNSSDNSTDWNPTFTYPGPGEYVITQTVFNNTTNCSHTTEQTVRITDPRANYTVSNTQGCAPLSVSIQDLSEYAASWTWSATGGVFSNDQSPEPTVTFDQPGAYTDLTLVITDEKGCQDTLVFPDTIYANAIEMDLSASPAVGCRPLSVQFTDQSVNLFATNEVWDWSFGVGQGNSLDRNPAHTYYESGEYDITLLIRDSWGCVGELTLPNEVEVTRPRASFTTQDTLACTQYCVSFVNESIGKDISFLWAFGDGESSTDENPTHCYQSEGVYSVCLTVTDGNGCDSTMCRQDYIIIADPVAAFTSDSTFASCPPLPVNFYNQSQNATDFVWDFGNNSGANTQENPAHIYTIPGSYAVTLIASSTPNCRDTAVLDDFIVLDGPVGSFSYTADSTCTPVEVTFVAESFTDYMYIWDFGDGTIDTVNQVDRDTAIHLYTSAGFYRPALSLIDNNSCKRTLFSPDSIEVSTLTLDFVASDTLFCDQYDPITFINLSSSSLDDNQYSWQFEGANPSSSDALEPTVIYDQPGIYDVILIGESGFCRDTIVKEDYIQLGPSPIADFNVSATIGCDPFEVQFTNMSTLSAGDIATYLWDFGDGTTSTEIDPIHTFTTEAVVTLTVTSEIGCVGMVSQAIELYPLPEIDMGSSFDACIGEVISLSASILGDTTGLEYQWLPLGSVDCGSCLETTALVNDTTTFELIVRTLDGCITSESLTINVGPQEVPQITLPSDTIICPEGPYQIFVGGGGNVFEYDWDPSRPGLTCYANCFNPIAQPTVPTTYVVTVTNAVGCTSVDSIFVDVYDEAYGFAGDDRAICKGDSILLETTGVQEVTWLVNDQLSCSYCPDPIAVPEGTTDYIVRGTDANDCILFDTVQVRVVETDLFTAGADRQICIGESLQLDAEAQGEIQWTPADLFDQSTTTTPIFTGVVTSEVVMTVTDDACTYSDTVRIEVIDKTDIEVEDQVVCLGDSVQLLVEGAADIINWEVNGSLSNWTSATPWATPTTDQAYTVVAQLRSCIPDTVTALVEVIDKPILSFNRVPGIFPGQPVGIRVKVEPEGNYTYNWTPPDLLNCTDCPSPIANADEQTTLMVEVMDEETGCMVMDSIVLPLLSSCPEELVDIPNVFSPNGDGVNDELKAFFARGLEGLNRFQVLDRWGTPMFETTDPTQGWDGTFNGVPAPEGVYIYFLEVPCPLDGQPFLKTGDVSLVR